MGNQIRLSVLKIGKYGQLEKAGSVRISVKTFVEGKGEKALRKLEKAVQKQTRQEKI